MARNPTALAEFIRGGYETYPAAFEAVDLFEAEMLRCIRDAFAKKQAWRGVQPATSGRVAATPLKNPRSANGISAYLQCVSQSGEPGVVISLGLIWNASRIGPKSVVAYAHCWAERGTRPVQPPPNLSARVKTGPLEKNDFRFFIVVDETFEPEQDFVLLLDAIDAGLGLTQLEGVAAGQRA